MNTEILDPFQGKICLNSQIKWTGTITVKWINQMEGYNPAW